LKVADHCPGAGKGKEKREAIEPSLTSKSIDLLRKGEEREGRKGEKGHIFTNFNTICFLYERTI